jgi:hypothetical protein
VRWRPYDERNASRLRPWGSATSTLFLAWLACSSEVGERFLHLGQQKPLSRKTESGGAAHQSTQKSNLAGVIHVVEGDAVELP